jgi:glycosyltransferase involved in cell wall biosynthesis
MRGRRGAALLPGFIRALGTERPAVFHAHLSWPLRCAWGLFGAALARVPAVIATQQLFVRIGSRRRAWRHRLLSLGVDRYIAVSHDVARKLRRVCSSPSRKIEVIPNGVLVENFDRPRNEELRWRLLRGENRPMVFTAARLDPQKGLEHLLAAARVVPNAVFVVAGDGPRREALGIQAKELGVSDRVLLLGHRTDVPDLLSACDLFVLPSLFEGLPISVLEAMAAGRPVVATAVGGTDEVVLPGITGLLVPPKDPEGLARGIRTLLDDPSLARRLAESARLRVCTEFSAQRVVARTVRLYETVLCGGAPAARGEEASHASV